MGMSPRLGYLVRPSFSRTGSSEANAWVQETPTPGDSAGEETRRACSERLWLKRLKWRVEG
jgi:hypothetical protein